MTTWLACLFIMTMAETPLPVPAGFEDLRPPRTLQYVVNDTPVACHLEDAGLPGDGDFTVSCTPIPKWTCATSAEPRLPDSRPAPAMWHQSGCYLAGGGVLRWFAQCPTTAPEADAGEVVLERWRDYQPLEDGQPPLSCTSSERPGFDPDVGYRREPNTAIGQCASPAHGWESAGASHSVVNPRMADWDYAFFTTACTDESLLVAVDMGLVPPRKCAVAERFAGHWVRNDRVEMRIEVDTKCGLAVTLRSPGEPEKSERRGPGRLAKCDVAIGGSPCMLATLREGSATRLLYLTTMGNGLQGMEESNGETTPLEATHTRLDSDGEDVGFEAECMANACHLTTAARPLRCDRDHYSFCFIRE